MDIPSIPRNDDDNTTTITKQWLKDICECQQGFRTPRLNNQLLMQRKSVQRIENLEEYINVVSLWLQENGIKVIENLDHFSKLKSLYLNSNFIKRIEGLEALSCLEDLNL